MSRLYNVVPKNAYYIDYKPRCFIYNFEVISVQTFIIKRKIFAVFLKLLSQQQSLYTMNSIKLYRSVKPRRIFSMGSSPRQSGQTKIFKLSLSMIFFYLNITNTSETLKTIN